MSITRGGGGWDQRFQCWVYSIVYDFGERAGYLSVEDGWTPKMGVCIAVFQSIDPLASFIQICHLQSHGGDLPHTTYVRNGGEWEAIAESTAGRC